MRQLPELSRGIRLQRHLPSVAAPCSCLALALLQVRALDAPKVQQPVSTFTQKTVKPVLSHENGGPRKTKTPGSLFGNCSQQPTAVDTCRRWLELLAVLTPGDHFSSRRSDRDTAPFLCLRDKNQRKGEYHNMFWCPTVGYAQAKGPSNFGGRPSDLIRTLSR